MILFPVFNSLDFIVFLPLFQKAKILIDTFLEIYEVNLE